MSDISTDPALNAAPIPTPVAVPVAAPAQTLSQYATPAPVQQTFDDLLNARPQTLAAGVAQYAGDLGNVAASRIPASIRAYLYPLAYLVSAGMVVLYEQHIVGLTPALFVAGTVTAFSHAVAFSNVPSAPKTK